MLSIVLFHSTATGISGFFSKLISLFELSPQGISHSAIKTMVNGEPWILHATLPTVAFMPMSEIMGNHTLVAEFEIVPDIFAEFKLAKEKRVGQPYDELTLLGYIPVLLARYLGIKYNNPFYSKSSEVCSELIVEMDIYHQIHEFDGLDPADITPQDLFNICSRGQSFKRVL